MCPPINSLSTSSKCSKLLQTLHTPIDTTLSWVDPRLQIRDSCWLTNDTAAREELCVAEVFDQTQESSELTKQVLLKYDMRFRQCVNTYMRKA